MAPKRAAADLKGKATAQAGTSAAEARGAAPQGTMPASLVGAATVSMVRHLVAANTHELGASSIAPGSSKVGVGYYPIFLHTLYAGLVPPFSSFQIGRASCRERVCQYV